MRQRSEQTEHHSDATFQPSIEATVRALISAYTTPLEAQIRRLGESVDAHIPPSSTAYISQQPYSEALPAVPLDMLAPSRESPPSPFDKNQLVANLEQMFPDPQNQESCWPPFESVIDLSNEPFRDWLHDSAHGASPYRCTCTCHENAIRGADGRCVIPRTSDSPTLLSDAPCGECKWMHTELGFD